MPLLDHFHPPLASDCPWTSFHSNWAVKMVDHLNPLIRSRGYRSHSEVHLGTQVAVDVGAFEREVPNFDPYGTNGTPGANGHGAVAQATEAYAPPKTEFRALVSFASADLFEVKIYRGKWSLVAAIELVSPSNKDRPDSRRAFAAKCAAFLQKGISVVAIDVVTESSANLHAELCDLLDLPPPLLWESPSGLSAIAYRTAMHAVKEQDLVRLEMWPHELVVGLELPTVPLWLAPDFAVGLELESTYTATCDSIGID